MTNRELIEKLQALPQDMTVCLIDNRLALDNKGDYWDFNIYEYPTYNDDDEEIGSIITILFESEEE